MPAPTCCRKLSSSSPRWTGGCNARPPDGAIPLPPTTTSTSHTPQQAVTEHASTATRTGPCRRCTCHPGSLRLPQPRRPDAQPAPPCPPPWPVEPAIFSSAATADVAASRAPEQRDRPPRARPHAAIDTSHGNRRPSRPRSGPKQPLIQAQARQPSRPALLPSPPTTADRTTPSLPAAAPPPASGILRGGLPPSHGAGNREV
jgi:hypothetical protein